MQTKPDDIGAFGALQELVKRDLLSVVYDAAPTSVFAFDALTRKFVSANRSGRKQIGLSWRRMQRMRLDDLLPGKPASQIARLMDGFRRRRRTQFFVRLGTKDDAPRLTRCDVLYIESEKPTILIFAMTAPSDYEEALKTNETLITSINSLPDGLVLYDADDRLVFCNEQYKAMYRESAAAMKPGARFEDILKYGLERGQYHDAIGRESAWLSERLAAHRDAGRTVEQHLSDGKWLRIHETETADGGRVGLRVDITKIKEQQAALDKLVRSDDLTGLLNRRGLNERIPEIYANLRDGQRVVLMQIDLDRFKVINELRGYDAGDHLLRHSAKLLTDGFLQPAAVARIGANEFVVVLRTRRSDRALLELADKLLSHLAQATHHAGQNLSVTGSIGIACLDPQASDPVLDVISAADLAMNRVKQNGGNDAMLFHKTLRDEAEYNNKMAEQILLGLTRREFMPFFQPQIDMATGQVIGFESLIRWQHPTKGLVPAFQFLEVAQRSGLTEAIDNIVMDRSCHAVRQLLDWGMCAPCVSINMSIAQISDPTIVTRLQCHMQTHGIKSHHLRIELLESTLLDKRSSQIVRNVHDLIAAGFPVELDDFGTGHAAIATLRKFAVSCIKIDRSLVQNIDKDSELQVITAAIINLAKRLGITVLAEGVEKETEQQTLRAMGCDRAQGYLHARPMPLDQLRNFLKERALID